MSMLAGEAVRGTALGITQLHVFFIWLISILYFFPVLLSPMVCPALTLSKHV